MILPGAQCVKLLAVKQAIDTAVETEDTEEFLRCLSYIRIKTQELWDEMIGNDPRGRAE